MDRKPDARIPMFGESLKELVSRVKKMETTQFPEFAEDFNIWSEGTAIPYIYFSPSYHFNQGLVNEDMLDKLQNGENMLSIGCGKAHLERLLVEGFSIDKSQIVLADNNAQDIPREFRFHQFDMHEYWWPEFDKKFTYVLFPECLGCTLGSFDSTINRDGTSEMIEAILNLIYRCFNEALEEYGEIRIDGHFLNDKTLEIIQQRLFEDGIELTWNQWLIVAKKATA